MRNPSGKLASAAGFPAGALGASVSSFSVVDTTNPCVASGASYSPGLTAQFRTAPALPSQPGALLSFGPANFTRCSRASTDAALNKACQIGRKPLGRKCLLACFVQRSAVSSRYLCGSDFLDLLPLS